MSTVDADVETPGAPLRESDPPGGHTELTSARLARVGDVEVRRLLPLRRRRSVGAWCFVDHYGPMSVDGVAGMQVPPHPHIGLQTVTWLLEGNVLHRDSLGSEQMIRPGQLNLMTAGHGIAHAEESPADHDPACTGCSSGWRCPMPTGRRRPPSSTMPSCRCWASAGRDHRLHRVAGRRHLPGPDVLPAGRRRDQRGARGRRHHPARLRPRARDLRRPRVICFYLPFGFHEETAEWLAFVDVYTMGNEFQRANRPGEMII